MEKVIIKICDPIMDGKAHSVELMDGRKAVAWNDKIEAGALMQAYAAHAEIEMELKPFTSKAGKTGLNVVSINYKNDASPTPQAPTSTGKSSILSVRDEIIIAQVILKEACENARHMTGDFEDVESEEKYLCEEVQMLTKVYKVALGELQ